MIQRLLLYTFFLLWCNIFSQSDSIAKNINSTKFQPKLINKLISSKFYTVKKINLEGTNRNKSAILIRSGLAEGDKIKIPSEITRDAIRKLWESNLFTDIKLYVQEIQEDEITLLFKLQETPQIGKIKVLKSDTGKSPSKSKREDLEGNLKNLTYRSYNQNVILRASEIIKKQYLEEGKLYPRITHFVQNDTTKNNTSSWSYW